ncbi:MAG: SpoIIE family protein phosphatase [Bacteroidaceae bacterium]|nr:SpoIIE family protein phosphatase [Bacteroidaceae bacterium]
MKKARKYNMSFARRLTRWVMLVLFIMMSALGYLIYQMTKSVVVEVSGGTFHSNMNVSAMTINKEMTDVSKTVRANVYAVEQSLGQPDQLEGIMRRILDQSPRVRSCGISFIEGYYPQKGRAFCPYVSRDSVQTDSIPAVGHRDDYLKAEWFTEALEADSAYWSEPFFDGRYARTPLVAYMVPIHDKQGRVVAILGADLSLGFMTELLKKLNNMFGHDSWAIAFTIDGVFNSHVITRDGTYITHPEHQRILKAKLYPHIKDADEEGVAKRVIENLKEGKRSIDETDKVLLVNRIKSYLFYIPISDTDWSMAVTVPVISIDFFGIAVGAAMLLIIIGMLMVTFFVCRLAIRRAAAPLKQLAATADEVASGQFDTPLPAIDSRDEIHLLRDSFENMQHSLTDYVEELKSATASKASIERELNIAHNIQMAMLPKTYPAFPDRHDIDAYGLVMPAKAVGGDLYDFFIRDDQLIFCIGDVSGKGVPASLVMAVTRSLFRNIGAYTKEPEQILIALNEALSSGNDTGMFATLFVGVLNLATGMLNYSNAGHNPPLVLSADNVDSLACDANIPVGVMEGWQYSRQERQLNVHDTVFLYTDGLSEAEDSDHRLFGIERVQQVARVSAIQPLRIIEAMVSSVKLFIGDAEQSDDLTMFAIQYTPTSE